MLLERPTTSVAKNCLNKKLARKLFLVWLIIFFLCHRKCPFAELYIKLLLTAGRLLLAGTVVGWSKVMYDL